MTFVKYFTMTICTWYLNYGIDSITFREWHRTVCAIFAMLGLRRKACSKSTFSLSWTWCPQPKLNYHDNGRYKKSWQVRLAFQQSIYSAIMSQWLWRWERPCCCLAKLFNFETEQGQKLNKFAEPNLRSNILFFLLLPTLHTQVSLKSISKGL